MRHLPSLLLALIAANIAAQTIPPTINYQGRLTDNTPAQAPLTGTVNMQFEIWDAAGGGTRQWAEPASGTTPVSVTGGIFNVLLGASAGGSSVPIPAAVFSGGTTRYLQLIVNGETLTPRQTLSATGYANQAENAGTAVTAGNSWQLGLVAAVNWQRVFSLASCPAGSFYNAISQSGIAGCAAPAANNLTPPVSLSYSGGATVLSASNSGTGIAIGGGSTSGDALAGVSVSGNGVSGVANGSGNGLYGRSVGGYAGQFVSSNAANFNPAVYVANGGGGTGVYAVSTASAAGQFAITNAANGNYALSATTTGAGEAFLGYSTGTGEAGTFQISNAANSSDAVSGTTNGTGAGVYGSGAPGVSGTTPVQGAAGVYGTNSNINSGYGVYGSATIGQGVYGLATTGWGVHGESSSGMGVVGQTSSASAAGVRAIGSGSGGTALQIESGAIRVFGAGNNTATAAFQYTTSATACSAGTRFAVLSNSTINGKSNLILMVTPSGYGNVAVSVTYDAAGTTCGTAGRWTLDSTDGSDIRTRAYNILVINP